MSSLLVALIAVVVVLHVGFLVLEMFLWRTPTGLKIFRMSRETADVSAVLAANQGLYNGFLAAGLFWGLCGADPVQARAVRLFFLSCVVIAGVYGAATVNRRIFFIQALPAIAALAVLFAVSV
jgi:putative membrane protein